MAKFRSWNEFDKIFYYFEDGQYHWTETVENEGGLTVTGIYKQLDCSRFDWQNAEQCFYENKVLPETIYKNDIGIIEYEDGYQIKGIVDVDMHKGLYIMKDNVKYYINDHCDEFFIIVGNIHEIKEETNED